MSLTPFEYHDRAGRVRYVAIDEEAIDQIAERERAAAEARQRGRAEALRGALNAIYEAGDRHYAASILRGEYPDLIV